MRQQRLPLGLLFAAVLSLAGCATMAPPYSQPASPVPAAWPSGPAYQGQGKEPAGPTATDLPWREFFVEPRLQEVIALALANNRDLRIAALTIERAQAQYRIQRAALLPTLDATAGGSGQGVAKDLSSSNDATTVEQYTVGLGVTAYELDLFGRVRSLKDKALAQYLASRETERAVRISLIAEVATAYLRLAADRERLTLATETLKAQEASYQLIERRFTLGAASELDLRQAQTRVDTARVDIARYTTLVAQDENGLQSVVGAPLPARLLPPSLTASLVAVRAIAPGLSSAVLLARPDVLAAEHLLKGMNANIGAARAAFFPRLTLVGSLGTASDELGGLFAPGSLAWTFAPRITVPIFDGGSNQANLAVAEVDRQIAVASYEKTIQTAFREVADALGQQGTIAEQLAAHESLTAATASSYRLSQLRYEKGVDSYLPVLDSQRSLYTAQQGLIATRLTRLTNLVTLYKVLGGGGDTPGLPPGE